MSKDQTGEDLVFDWPCDIGHEEMARLIAWAEARGIPPKKFPNAKNKAGSESAATPPVFSYEDAEGQLVFIHDLGLEGLLNLPHGAGAEVFPAAPKLPLSRASQICGPDLAGYVRTYRLSAPAGGTAVTRIDYSVQLFVKNPGKAA